MRLPEGIKVDQAIMMGKPCVRDTRIPVYLLLQKKSGRRKPGSALESVSPAQPGGPSGRLGVCDPFRGRGGRARRRLGVFPIR
jgi:Protein of unknown function (DUF433)